MLSKKHVGRWLWVREWRGDRVGRAQPDLDVHFRWGLVRFVPMARPWHDSHVLEAYFCEYCQSWEHVHLKVLDADRSSSSDKSLFSEVALIADVI